MLRILKIVAALLLFFPLTEIFVGALVYLLASVTGLSPYGPFSAAVVAVGVTMLIKYEPFSEMFGARRKRQKTPPA